MKQLYKTQIEIFSFILNQKYIYLSLLVTSLLISKAMAETTLVAQNNLRIPINSSVCSRLATWMGNGDTSVCNEEEPVRRHRNRRDPVQAHQSCSPDELYAAYYRELENGFGIPMNGESTNNVNYLPYESWENDGPVEGFLIDSDEDKALTAGRLSVAMSSPGWYAELVNLGENRVSVRGWEGFNSNYHRMPSLKADFISMNGSLSELERFQFLSQLIPTKGDSVILFKCRSDFGLFRQHHNGDQLLKPYKYRIPN